MNRKILQAKRPAIAKLTDRLNEERKKKPKCMWRNKFKNKKRKNK